MPQLREPDRRHGRRRRARQERPATTGSGRRRDRLRLGTGRRRLRSRQRADADRLKGGPGDDRVNGGARRDRIARRLRRGPPSRAEAATTASSRGRRSGPGPLRQGQEGPRPGRRARPVHQLRAREDARTSGPEHRQGDSEVLDRQARRVEERDRRQPTSVLRPRPPGPRPARQLSSRSTIPALTPFDSSPPFEACSHSSQKSPHRSTAASSTSALPCASAPRTAKCWPGRRSIARTTGLVARRDGDDDVLGGRLLSRCRRSSRARPPAPRRSPARASAQTPVPYPAAARQRAAHPPLTPQPITPTVRASSRARACAETAAAAPVRSDVTARAVEDREKLAGLGARDKERAGDDRQPARRVARERRHPLEDREPLAAGRHRPEVAVRRRVDVGLRRHDPFAGVVALERDPRPLDRLGGRNGGEDRFGIDHADLGHASAG